MNFLNQINIVESLVSRGYVYVDTFMIQEDTDKLKGIIYSNNEKSALLLSKPRNVLNMGLCSFFDKEFGDKYRLLGMPLIEDSKILSLESKNSLKCIINDNWFLEKRLDELSINLFGEPFQIKEGIDAFEYLQKDLKIINSNPFGIKNVYAFPQKS